MCIPFPIKNKIIHIPLKGYRENSIMKTGKTGVQCVRENTTIATAANKLDCKKF